MFWGDEGADIVRRIGSDFGLLPVPARFSCRFHRAQKSAEEIQRLWRDTYVAQLPDHLRAQGQTGPLPPMELLECEMATWWPPNVPEDCLEAGHFPQPTLPDDRWVVCVSFDPDLRPSHVRSEHWRKIVSAAEVGRTGLLRHALEVATARLEEWSSVGTAVRCHYDLIAPKGERGPALAADNSSLPDLSRFSELVTWIQDWDLDLWNRPEEPFAPSARALDVLGRRLGIAPDTINTWVTSSCIPVDHLMSERELIKQRR